jgi:dienelactone hydrolase
MNFGKATLPVVPVLALVAGLMVSIAVGPTNAAEAYRVLAPLADSPKPAVLLVPGCSGFVSRNGYNLYEDRAQELQAAGYFVVFVDYLGRRHLPHCAGGRDVSHVEVGSDILNAAQWIKQQPGVAGQVFAIGWSFGGGGLLAAVEAMPAVGSPLIAKAAFYYPVCSRAKRWLSSEITGLMLLGGADEVALPKLCDVVIRGAPPGSVRIIVYPNARHAFDNKSLPERAEFGRIGYNASAAEASWRAVLDFLQ